MRKIIVSEFVTLDGVMEAPGGEPGHPHSGWVRDFMGPEQLRYKLDEVLDAQSLLIGRVTYESFSAAWPERSGEFADKMNAMPKHGRRLFPETQDKTALRLADTRMFSSGVVVHSYYRVST